MNALSSFQLYELTRTFIKDKEKAKSFVEKIEATVDHKMEQRFEHLATKSDLAALKVELMDMLFRQKEELMGVITQQRTELIKSIYLVGLIQFLAIVGSVLAIVTFMLR
ncbi:MAG: hypothetical protein ACON47_05410 [Flavobacteriaceae bacterium]